MQKQGTAKRRRWADVAVLVASVYAFLAAVWSPPELFTGGDAAEVGATVWLMVAYAAGGLLGIAALIVAQKWTVPGRVLAAVAGLAILSGLLAMRELTALALASLGGSGLLLLLASPFMGRMPSPEEERREDELRKRG